MLKPRLFIVVLIMILTLIACARAETVLLCLDGCTVVYGEGCGEMVAEACAALQKKLGLPSASDTADAVALEILVGPTNRAESAGIGEGLGQFDYRIAIENGKLVLTGGSDVAVLNAVAALLHDETAILTDADGHLAIAADYAVAFDGADSREEYMNDPGLFLCNWALEFDPPTWLLDFDEKLDSFADPTGRMMSCLHRGDWIHYPENSIENIISCINMGVDCIEVDVSRTKDNVLVLMHSELSASTDFREKNGRNGLPTSEVVSDWTYEQLLELRLLDTHGNVTDCIVPTLKEALAVCKGHTTMCLDSKAAGLNLWTEVYPLLLETEAWHAIFFSTYEGWVELAAAIKENSGRQALVNGGLNTFEVDKWQGTMNWFASQGVPAPIMTLMDMSRTNPARQIERWGEEMEPWKNTIRFYAILQATNAKKLSAALEAYAANGAFVIQMDDGLALQQFIADTYGQ